MSDGKLRSAATLSAELIAARCESALAGTPLQLRVMEEVDSTNSEASRWRRERGGDDAVVAVTAQRQLAGRGRRGRVWETARASAIHLSLARRVDCDHSVAPLGLACALGVHEVLATLGAASSLAIKWPNDIVCAPSGAGSYAKLGGLLLEASAVPGAGGALEIVVGIGLNVRLPSALRQSLERASLHEVADFQTVGLAHVAIDETVAALIVTTVRTIDAFVMEGFAGFAARWPAVDALRGRTVRVLASDGSEREGVASGVDRDGALGIRVPQSPELLRVHSGEVTVRPL